MTVACPVQPGPSPPHSCGVVHRDKDKPELLSGLVFAGANDSPDFPMDLSQLAALPADGVLTAEEAAFLSLSGVRLAVLSACETGLGTVASGEGLLGMQRSFQTSSASDGL